MRIRTAVHHDVTQIDLHGELTSEAVIKLTEAIDEAFAANRRDFVVDLSEITSVDSVGLEALTALQRRCDDELGMVRFCGLDETLTKVFEITRLDKMFTLHESADDALASFAQA